MGNYLGKYTAEQTRSMKTCKNLQSPAALRNVTNCGPGGEGSRIGIMDAGCNAGNAQTHRQSTTDPAAAL